MFPNLFSRTFQEVFQMWLSPWRLPWVPHAEGASSLPPETGVHSPLVTTTVLTKIQPNIQGTHGYSHFLKSRNHISSLFVFELTIVPNTVLYIQMFVTLSYIVILVYWIWLETSSPLVNILKSCSYTEYLLRWFFCIITGSKRELIIITISWASTLCQDLTYYVV